MDEYEGAMMPADMRPCPFCAELIKVAAIVCRYCQRDVRMMPQPVQQPQFDVQAQPTMRTPTQLAVSRAIWIGVGVALVAFIGVGTFVAYKQAHAPRSAGERNYYKEPSTPPTQERTSEIVKYQPTKAERIVAAHRPFDVAQIVPLGDSVDEVHPGAAALALWSMKNLRWSEVAIDPQTTWAAVMKDSSAERGKRACFSGSIIEIEASRDEAGLIWVGGMFVNGYDPVRFIAVANSDGVQASGHARICGYVTGKQSYTNSANGMTHAVFIVGMFDTPKNRSER